jgi:Ca2+-binding EF-hand superfamily protein
MTDRPFSTAECKEFFDFIDVDKSGTIDIEEIQRLLRVLGFDDNIQFAERIMLEANRSSSRSICWEDFYRTVNPERSSTYSNEEVLRAFQFYAGKQSPSNKIHRDVLQEVLLQCRSDREVAIILKQLPFDSQGYLNYHDFVKTYN